METTQNPETVKQLIQEELGVLLYFYNDDCAPCISLRPKVESLMEQRFPKMKILWVNSKATPDIPASYSVFANPTILVFFDGKEFKRFSKYVSINELDNGNYEVGIHIADVAHYVTKNKSIFEEAYKRGTSIYIVGKVIPMLPEHLSNTICSLVPNEDRLTYSVIIELTKRCRIVTKYIKLCYRFR